MVIADQMEAKVRLSSIQFLTSRFYKIGLLICFAFILPISGQNTRSAEFEQAQIEFDNGSYQRAIELAKVEYEIARRTKNYLVISRLQNIITESQISLGKYEVAKKMLEESLRKIPKDNIYSFQRALLKIQFARLYKSQYKFREALNQMKQSIKIEPKNDQIKAKYFLNVGRILYSSGYDVSAIIWFEKAEKALNSEQISQAKLETFRFLSLAWSSKLNYQKALKYALKYSDSSENTQFKYEYRQALFDLANIYSVTNQKQTAFATLEKGLKLSLKEKNTLQSSNFLSSLVLNYLSIVNISRANIYLQKLEKIDLERKFAFEITLSKAVISAYGGQHEISEKLFNDLDKMESYSEFMIPIWKLTIAEKNQNWEKMIKLNHNLLELTTKNNFRDDLPSIYLDFAKAYYYLKQPTKSLENLERSLSIIEEIRKSENSNLSLGLFETYHKAYRLLAQLKSKDVQESFELADFLKARFLKDRINNSIFRGNTNVSPAMREKLKEFSLKFIDDQSVAEEIEKQEKLVTNLIPDLDLNKPDLTQLDDLNDLKDKAIVSYFFTLDKKLLAYVWEKNHPLKIIDLPVSESEMEVEAKNTHQKIKNSLFFKRDGKKLYDKLLKPLSIKANHLIIIPDKSLWKIPFQALSPDGMNYLIEEKLVSYSPSISILVNQLKKPKPNRQSFQAFANSTFENKSLKYVNIEAIGVANIYKTKPILNATIADFEKASSKSDINHFSMHAQVADEQPLDSFLAFRKNGENDGRLTVEEILDINLKDRSLAFLASCDTTNVLNGEGLVSLSWAMMASGATTVISAQWEANDKSTEVFTKSFYENYKQGSSSAEALQKASLELIKNKENNMHEPYYWAEFMLNGDFR